VAPFVLLLQQTRLYFMNAERTGLWLWQKDHICGHLGYMHSMAVNQMIVNHREIMI
jgi:hypothetical protein